jgi:hypothetical protein
VDLTRRMPREERWTFHDPESGGRFLPDALLASPRLAADFAQAVPVRCGRGCRATRGGGRGRGCGTWESTARMRAIMRRWWWTFPGSDGERAAGVVPAARTS